MLQPSDRLATVITITFQEYTTLRAEILARSAQRSQFLTVAVAAVALLAGLHGGAEVPLPFIATLIVIIALVAVYVWARAGTSITALGRRIAELERIVNTAYLEACAPQVVEPLLDWETWRRSLHGASAVLNWPDYKTPASRAADDGSSTART